MEAYGRDGDYGYFGYGFGFKFGRPAGRAGRANCRKRTGQQYRQIQGNTLSARTLPGGQSPQYYLMKFDLKNPKQYTAEAIYNVSSGSPQLTDIQTFILPPDVQIDHSVGEFSHYHFQAWRYNPDYLDPAGSLRQLRLSGFCRPVRKDDAKRLLFIASAPSISSGDDYYYIVNFVSNIPCASSNLPAARRARRDALLAQIP